MTTTDTTERGLERVVTDRRILDQQIRHTIRQFAQMGATVAHA